MRPLKRVRLLSLLICLAIGVLALAAIASGSATGGGKQPLPDPDAGLTEAQRLAKHSDLRSQFEQHLAKWAAALDVTSLDLTRLPRQEILATYRPGPDTLETAVSAADAIVIGSVVKVVPNGLSAVADVHVESQIKGGVGGDIQVAMRSGFRPTPDWTGVVIADAPVDPLLLPGQRVVLLLRRLADGSAGFEPLIGAGQYTLKSGAVFPIALSPFVDQVAGRTEADFVNELAAMAARGH